MRGLLKLTGLLAVLGCGGEPSSPSPLRVTGLSQAWSLDGIQGAADFEFFGGDLYVLGGVDAPELWQVELDGTIPVPRLIPTDDLPKGRPRLLESNRYLLYAAGHWGREVFALRQSGEVLGDPRRVSGGYDFLPWITGEFLAVGRPSRPVILIERLLPMQGREYKSRWGSLPTTPSGPIDRGERSPVSDVFIDSDESNRVHALVNASSTLVQYNALGEATLVRRLPADMIQLGNASAWGGYGQPLERFSNGLELSCSGELWVSVGEEEQRVAVFDPADYRVVARKTFAAPHVTDAVWSSCGEWVVGLSSESGRVVLGLASQAPRRARRP